MSWSDEPPEDDLEEPIIREILDKGVSETIEFFPAIPEKRKELAREAVGIANSRGGVILLGVSPDGDLIGLSEPRGVWNDTTEILEERIEPSLKYSMNTHEIEGEEIVSIRIKMYEQLPFAMERTFYLRKSHSSEPLPPVNVFELMKRSKQFGES